MKWKRGNEKKRRELKKRGQTIKYIRWKGGERVISKIDEGKRNEGID